MIDTGLYETLDEIREELVEILQSRLTPEQVQELVMEPWLTLRKELEEPS